MTPDLGYRFYVSYGGTNVVQVYPLNWLDCTLNDEKERDQAFYRRKFQGSLTFGAGRIEITEESGVNVVSYICDEYTLFNDIRIADPFARIDLLILKDLNIYYEGYFSISKGEWDFDNKTFKITPLPTDDYVEWVEHGDDKYDILALPSVTTVYSDGGTITNYTRTKLLTAVIEYLAQHVFGAAYTWASGKIHSNFFTDLINPITGVANRYNYMTIAQKSDVLRPASSNQATLKTMSFNDLMKILKCMNLRWEFSLVYDMLTIEHISYWESEPEIDIRTQEMAIASNKFKYSDTDLPKYENFYWMEAGNADFVGVPIHYDSLGVNQDPDSNTSDFQLDVTTDIDYIKKCIADGEESKISDSGWVLFANEYVTPDYYIYMNSGILQPGVVYFNCDLSWGRLHNAFFKHERQLPTGYMNNLLTTFYSSKKIKQQEEFSIIHCYPFNPKNYITSELGETYFGGEKGDIVKASIKPYGEIKLTVNYGPTQNPIVPIPNLKIIRIVESGICGQLHAALSPAADADLDIYIGYEILDQYGVFLCGENAGDTPVWTIHNGEKESDFTVNFDGAGCGGGIPVGGCWNPITDYTDPQGKGWSVYAIIQDSICQC